MAADGAATSGTAGGEASEGVQAGEVRVSVQLMSGRTVAADISCSRISSVLQLKAQLCAECGEELPFRLLHGGQLLESRASLASLPDVAQLTLVRTSVAAVSNGLVGFNGAAFCGDVLRLRDLLDDGADVNWRDGDRLRTPLMWAAAAGQVDAAAELLQRGADPKLRAASCTAAGIAAANGHEVLARMLATQDERPPSRSPTQREAPLALRVQKGLRGFSRKVTHLICKDVPKKKFWLLVTSMLSCLWSICSTLPSLTSQIVVTCLFACCFQWLVTGLASKPRRSPGMVAAMPANQRPVREAGRSPVRAPPPRVAL